MVLFCVPPPSAMLVYILLATWHLDIIMYMCYNIYIRLRNDHSGYSAIAFVMPHEMRLESLQSNANFSKHAQRSRNRLRYDVGRICGDNHHCVSSPVRRPCLGTDTTLDHREPVDGAVCSQVVATSKPPVGGMANTPSLDKLEA